MVWDGTNGSVTGNIKLIKDRSSFFVLDRTRLFYEYGKDKKHSQEDFMKLFDEGGDLFSLRKNIYAWNSLTRGVFEITFNSLDFALKQVEDRLSQPQKLKTSNGLMVNVKIGFPWQPVYHLTLRGVPMEYDLDVLKNDMSCMGWGEVRSVLPGYHKREWGDVRNCFVHVKMAKSDLTKIPSVFYLQGHEVYVTKPGKRVKQFCNFCHKPWHLEETCWAKQRELEDLEYKKEEDERRVKRKEFLAAKDKEREDREFQKMRFLEELKAKKKAEEEKLNQLEKEKANDDSAMAIRITASADGSGISDGNLPAVKIVNEVTVDNEIIGDEGVSDENSVHYHSEQEEVSNSSAVSGLGEDVPKAGAYETVSNGVESLVEKQDSFSVGEQNAPVAHVNVIDAGSSTQQFLDVPSDDLGDTGLVGNSHKDESNDSGDADGESSDNDSTVKSVTDGESNLGSLPGERPKFSPKRRRSSTQRDRAFGSKSKTRHNMLSSQLKEWKNMKSKKEDLISEHDGLSKTE